jgi:hypothetical protein
VRHSPSSDRSIAGPALVRAAILTSLLLTAVAIVIVIIYEFS